MSVRIINVFYNDRGLPYQDQERTVLFPVLGSAFLGASNTTQIRFYCDRVGGGRSNAVVYGKLANGKKVFTILGEYTEDSELGESYYTFSLDSHYTECKGDLMLSLGTYNGVLVEEQADTTYDLTGNTIIEMTGVIKLNIAYAVIDNPSDEQIETWQELLGALGEKADKNKVIITFDTESAMTNGANAYDNGQYFYVKETQTIYQKISGTLTPIFTAYSKTESDSKYFINASNNTASGNNTFSGQNTFSGRAVFSGNANLYNTYLTTNTKNYFVRVGTTTGQYVMYKLPYNYSDLGSEATYSLITKEYTDTQLALKADKSNTYTKSETDTLLNNKADKATTYTKTEVDNLVDTIKSGELEIVDTTTYPTLNDFLATTGEEGHIYLYPIDINDLTKGYYRYVWEEISGTSQWVSLGTTEIDLSDYYTKTQADNKFVEQVSGKGLSSNDFTDNDKNKLDGIESGAEVNVIEEIKVDNVALTPTDKSVNIDLSGKQDALVSGTNIKTLNNTSLLGSGNIDYDNALSDSSTNAVQNKVLKGYLDDIGNRLAVLEESIISDESLNYTYLSDSAIPSNANTYPIIESAGMDNTNIKGNSVVINQLCNNGHVQFSIVPSGHFITLVSSPTISHKYLICNFKPVNSSDYSKFRLFRNGNGSALSNVSDIIISTSTTTDDIYIDAYSTYVGSEYPYDTYPQAIDLTKWFGSNDNIPTDLTNDPSLFFTKYYTKSDYITYNAGTLLSSKPTALISKSFNVWDEETKSGLYNVSTGAFQSDNTRLCSVNPIPVLFNTTYYKNKGFNWVIYYDKNMNYISSYLITGNTFTTPSNCYYIHIDLDTAYGTTYNNDICINISNATLNGTYRPYKAPISYPLNLPVLRSAGSVQDDTKKANVGAIDLSSPDLTWIKIGSTSSGYYAWRCTNIPNIKYVSLNTQIGNAIWSKGGTIRQGSGITGNVALYSFAIDTSQVSFVVENGTNHPTGTFYYELATPIDQPSITLPENIEFEKGGSLEVTYDSTAPTPSDFDFEVAVYKPIQ